MKKWIFAFVFYFIFITVVFSSVHAEPKFWSVDWSPWIQKMNPDISERRANNLSYLTNKYSRKYDESSLLIISIMQHESSRFHNVKGPTGEAGYMQITPNTFQNFCGYKTTLERLITDFKENVRCGIYIFSQHRKEHGKVSAIGHYNWPANGDRNLDYIRYVLNAREMIKEEFLGK